MHTKQLQQYTQHNYNNTHNTTNNNTHNTTNNNTHNKTTTIHTTQLTTIHTTHLTTQPVQTVNNTTVRKYCIQFPVFFPTHTVLTLSPQPITSHHFTAHINVSHKVSFLPLPYTALHFTSFHFTTLLDDFHFILLCFFTILDDFQNIFSYFNSPR